MSRIVLTGYVLSHVFELKSLELKYMWYSTSTDVWCFGSKTSEQLEHNFCDIQSCLAPAECMYYVGTFWHELQVSDHYFLNWTELLWKSTGNHEFDCNPTLQLQDVRTPVVFFKFFIFLWALQ